MDYLAEVKANINGITPENMTKDLIEALAGYENITVYNNLIRLIPFSKSLDTTIKASGERAYASTDHWIRKVEVPFSNTYSAIKSIFLTDDIFTDLEKELKNYLANKTPKILKDIDDIVKDCKKGLKTHKKTIDNTNIQVDNFRDLLAIDHQNFNDLKERLPKILDNVKEKQLEQAAIVERKTIKLQKLNLTVRIKSLELLEVDDDIRKAGIACAIPIVNIGGMIAMAVLLGKKSNINKEINDLDGQARKIENDLLQDNALLDQYNSQAPLLTAMITQVPILADLSTQVAEVAHSIKLTWTNIGFSLDELDKVLTVSTDQTDRSLRKLAMKARSLQDDLIKLLDNYNKSINLGCPVSPDVQKAFKINDRIGSKYYFSDSQTGMLYLPNDELYEITGKIHASYK